MTTSIRSARHKILAAVAALGEAQAGKIAAHAGLGYSTVPPKLRILQAEGIAEWFESDGKRIWRLTPEGVAATRRTSQPSTVDKTEPGPRGKAERGANTPPAQPAEGGPAPEVAAAGSGETPRRPGGSLRNTVLKVLQDHPEHQFRVLEVCRAIDDLGTGGAKASAGAVRNALDRLAGQGSILLIVDRPATFQAV